MIQQLITCASSLSFVFQIYKDMQKLKNAISHCSFPLQRERRLNVTPPAVFEQWPQLKVCQRGCEEKHQVDKGVKIRIHWKGLDWRKSERWAKGSSRTLSFISAKGSFPSKNTSFKVLFVLHPGATDIFFACRHSICLITLLPWKQFAII